MSNETKFVNGVMIEQWSDFLQKAIREESGWVQGIFVASMLTIFVVSLVGNLLTCIVIYNDRTMHTATNYYLFNLAVSDLIVAFGILIDLHDQVIESYQFGELGCKIHYFLIVALWNNSILIMTALAIERYTAIWYPLALKSTPVWHRVIKIIVLLWIVALLEALPEVWTVQLVRSHKTSICCSVPTKFARVLNGVLALLTFVIPLVIMMFVYTMIAFKVNVTTRKNSRDKIFNNRNNRSKVNKLITLTVSFLVCWLPFFTMRIFIFAFDTNLLMGRPKWWGIGYRVACFNSTFSIVLNPLLFSLMSTKFRKALKAMWSTKFKKRYSVKTKTITTV